MIQDDFRAAVDIGTTKVCTLLARRRSDGRLELTAFSSIPCTGLRRGQVEDTGAITEAVRASLTEVSAQAGLRINQAYIGLTGNQIESENRWKKVTQHGDVRTVTEDDISVALKSAGEFNLDENRQLVHVIPRSYALDGLHGVRNPLGMHASQIHIQSHVVTDTIDHMERLSEAVLAAGVTPADMVANAIVSAEAVLTVDEREDGVLSIDIGGGTTDIAVFCDGAVVHTSGIPIGGYQFSNDIAIAFDTNYAEAARLKRSYGTATPELVGMTEEIPIRRRSTDEPLMITRREIGQVLNDRVKELLEMVKLKIDFPNSDEFQINRIVMTGGSARLEGIDTLARYVFQRQVRLAKPRGINSMLSEHSNPAYSTAIGTLIWGARNHPVGSHVSTTVSRSSTSLRQLLSRYRSWISSFGRRRVSNSSSANVAR